MLPDRTPVTVRAPAKINLSLGVGSRRADGFHDVRTVYQAVDLYDMVTVTPADTLSLDIDGPESGGLAADNRNLVWRAAELIAAHVRRAPRLQIHLTKHIPVAAGLAGGSADAAATLRAVNELWGLDLDADALGSLAAELGSDVNFALLGGTALGTGRGERLTPLAPCLTHWVLAVADGGLSTPAVFSEFDAHGARGTAIPATEPASVISALQNQDLRQLAAGLANDLQPAALMLADYLPAVLAAGLQAGALAVLVSGSGPTVVLLARSSSHAEQLSTTLSASRCCRYAVAVTGGVTGAQVLRSGVSPAPIGLSPAPIGQ